jgi:murein DD-endopeptidase MepM/ murein hydrolase activator NlpD
MLSPASAKKLYKYQDEQGIWHYTDVPPETDQPTEVRQLQPADEPYRVSLQQRGSATQPTFYLVNHYHGPIEVEVELAGPSPVVIEPPLPKRFVVPGVSELLAFTVRAVKYIDRGYYRIRYHSVIGDPHAQHTPARPYQPPFPKTESFLITQAFHDRSTHNDLQSLYAVDIAMPEGTPVCAARAGVVIEVANDYFENGLSVNRYATRANLVRILHPDGTMALYAHLKLESARVAPGTRVEEGQVIAESGNTGFSSGPHLHFAVQKNQGLQLVSVPFLFRDEQGYGITPRRGMILTAF